MTTISVSADPTQVEEGSQLLWNFSLTEAVAPGGLAVELDLVEDTDRTKKTVENRNSFYLDIGLTNTGCTAQLTIPSAVNAPGNFFLII